VANVEVMDEVFKAYAKQPLLEFLDLLMKFFIDIYILSLLVKKIINDLIDIHNLLEKLSLVICGLSVSLSIITLLMDLLAQK
jgi:hypothetical protein